MLKIPTILKPFKEKDNNPFQDILSALNTDTVLITMSYLNELKTLCEKRGVIFTTYGAVFDMLRFLEAHKCVTIQETATGEYTMTGLHQYGKNNHQ